MRWIKQIEPVTLYQASDLPYIIKEEGVYLCFDNFYSEVQSSGEHTISFQIDRKRLSRKSSTYYKIATFPTVIPFKDITELDESIIGGRIIKHAPEIDGTKNILIIKASHICGLSDNKFQALVSNIESHDESFLLIEEPIDPQVRLLDDLVHTIICSENQGWERICVTIADIVCTTPHRKYCWIKSVPELTIQCYGLTDSDEKYDLQTCLENIGLDECSVIWED